MSLYEIVEGNGETITCDDCDIVTGNWYCGEERAICTDCAEYYLQSIEGESK